MKTSKPNALQIWEQVEDILVPRLRLSVYDRAVYWHLLRHSRLEGKRQIKFAIRRLGRTVQLSEGPVRRSVRRLAMHGALRVIQRSKQGHVVEVRLPEEIRAARPRKGEHRQLGERLSAANFEEADFRISEQLRKAIHARESGRCFYCMRRIPAMVKCLDHVVPQVRRGHNSYRNLVSCCLACNSRKGEQNAARFLRWLYRERRLDATELSERLRALDTLAAGKLRPRLAAASMPLPRQR